MSIFKKIRQQISKRRKPPQKKRQGFEVPACDYNLLQFIRLTVAKGDTVTIHPTNVFTGKDDNEWKYHNAKILHDFYRMNQQEVLITTGFWVEGK